MKGQIEIKVIIDVDDVGIIKRYKEESLKFKEVIAYVILEAGLEGNVKSIKFQLKD